MTRRHNPRLLQSYRLYTIPQLAALLRVGKNTISRWISLGLVPVEWRRPYLFKGFVVAEFLRALNPPKCRLGPGQAYCTPCRGPVRPLSGVVSLIPWTGTSGNLKGTCPVCGHQVRRTVKYSNLRTDLGDLIIRYEDEKAPVFSSADGPRMECSGDAAP